MNQTAAQNKVLVARFNKEVIEQGNMETFNELTAPNVINHSAPPGTPHGPDSMGYFLFHILRAGFSGIEVQLHEQLAERDMVSTRKTITATHTGELFGMPPTNKNVSITVIDIIRLEHGKYAEHWGQSNFADVIAALAKG